MHKKFSVKKWAFSIFCVFLILPLVGFFIPYRPYANPLTPDDAPSFTLKGFLSGQFQTETNSYLNDQIIGYRALIHLKTDLDLAIGKKESNGVYISDKMLIDKPTLPDSKACSEAAGTINRFAEQTGKKTFTLILPTSAQINSSYLPAYAPKTDELSLISGFGNQLSPSVPLLDAATPLTAVKDSGVYYRTDPRLTSLGAFSIYNYNMKTLGFTPASTEDFNIEYSTGDFRGSLYDRTFYDGVAPDRVDLYHYNAKTIEATVESLDEHTSALRNSLFDTSLQGSPDSVYALFGEPAAVKTLKKGDGSGKKLFIFGDENVDPFIQFFALHYDMITVVNPQTADLSQLTMDGADQVLFLFGIESLASDDFFTPLQNALSGWYGANR